MKKIVPFIPFIFPALIILFGLFIYKILEYEPNFFTIVINISLAFVLSPRIKKIQKQNGPEKQITWLFYKNILK